jgi:mono/diheme cytochrome c family protein
MPWMYLHRLTDETIAAKLVRPLPAAPPTVLTYADGNFGSMTAPTWRHRPQPALVLVQWMVAAVGVVAFVFAAPPGRRWPRTWRGWLGSAFALLGLIAAAMAGWAPHGLLALQVIPAEEIARTVTASIPRPAPVGSASPEQTALVARGRYLYTVASCALCHGNDGAGGAKISWAALGTLWARNITPDRDTGIGTWSPRAIARAIRSGLTPDGRVLHWQGMIWDHASNWDEEDVRALIAYLCSMPPIRRVIPPAHPPAPDDCTTYTFWVASSTARGCR